MVLPFPFLLYSFKSIYISLTLQQSHSLLILSLDIVSFFGTFQLLEFVSSPLPLLPNSCASFPLIKRSKMAESEADGLVNFLFYVVIVYPVTNWLLKKYKDNRGMYLAICFLSVVAAGKTVSANIFYENTAFLLLTLTDIRWGD